MAGEAIEVFFSYSHRDEELRDKLAEHLSILKRQGVISEWHDRQIGAGTEWEGEIDQRLNQADIILLLISSSFLNSDYCWSVELQQAMRRHDAGNACVIPIILRPVDWAGAPFSKLQAYPKDAKPVTRWDDRDEAFLNITQGIRTAAQRLIAARQPLPLLSIKTAPAPEEAATTEIRESGQEESHYRKEVKHCAREEGGEISALNRIYLDGLRDSLRLSIERSHDIEQEILRPYQTYSNTFRGIVQQQYPVKAVTRDRLSRLQQLLALTDAEIGAIESRIVAQRQSVNPPMVETARRDRTKPPVVQAAKEIEPADDLSSERGIDYTKLRDLLKAGKWKEADYETYLVMLQAVGRKEGNSIRPKELLNFPCTDLRTIDQLWIKYSNGKFGFSVQKRIYLECGGKLDGKYDEETWKKFGDRVGWRVHKGWLDYDNITFSTSASFSYGYLPVRGVVWIEVVDGLGFWVFSGGWISSLASRLVTCSS